MSPVLTAFVSRTKDGRFLLASVTSTAMTVLLIGCVAVASILAVAAKEVANAANLPSITPVQNSWLIAASSGLACSSTVLTKGEPAVQEAVDIGACFATLPIIPITEQTYISFAIDAVDAFIILYEPLPAASSTTSVARTSQAGQFKEDPRALKSNSDVRAGKHIAEFNSQMAQISNSMNGIKVRLSQK